MMSVGSVDETSIDMKRVNFLLAETHIRLASLLSPSTHRGVNSIANPTFSSEL